MKENDQYKIHKIHSSANVEASEPKATSITHKLFAIKGKHDFDGLDLREYKWERIHAPSPIQRKAFEETNDPRYSEETMVYKGPQGVAVMYLNYATDNHQLDISFKDNPESKPATIELLKWMFESELGCTLEDREEFHSGLLKKLKSK